MADCGGVSATGCQLTNIVSFGTPGHSYHVSYWHGLVVATTLSNLRYLAEHKIQHQCRETMPEDRGQHNEKFNDEGVPEDRGQHNEK